MCTTEGLQFGSDKRLEALDPRVKIAAALGVIVGVAAIPANAWISFGIVFGMLWVVAWLSRVPPWRILCRTMLIVPFFAAAAPLMFTVAGPPLFQFPAVGWIATAPGMERFATIVLRATLSLFCAILLSASTPFPSLLLGLRGLGMSRTLLSILGCMHRYAWILRDEAHCMMRAAASRSARPPGARAPAPWWRARHAGAMVATILVRALDRSERVYGAMLARGYDGCPRMLVACRFRTRDLAAIGMVVAVLGAVAWLAR